MSAYVVLKQVPSVLSSLLRVPKNCRGWVQAGVPCPVCDSECWNPPLIGVRSWIAQHSSILRAASRGAAGSRERRGGGREEGKRGRAQGVPGKLGCADVTGRAIWLERFKKGACERRCCCAQLRPPAAVTTAHRHCGDCSEGGGGSRGWCGHSARHGPHGATTRQTPAWLQTPGELQKNHWGCRRPVNCRSP